MRAGGAAECSSPCHGEGRGFKSRPARQVLKYYSTYAIIFLCQSIFLQKAI
jgi:hypothetical protein